MQRNNPRGRGKWLAGQSGVPNQSQDMPTIPPQKRSEGTDGKKVQGDPSSKIGEANSKPEQGRKQPLLVSKYTFSPPHGQPSYRMPNTFAEQEKDASRRISRPLFHEEEEEFPSCTVNSIRAEFYYKVTRANVEDKYEFLPIDPDKSANADKPKSEIRDDEKAKAIRAEFFQRISQASLKGQVSNNVGGNPFTPSQPPRIAPLSMKLTKPDKTDGSELI